MSFVKGDRVKYTGNGSYNTPGLFGKVGTVKTVEHVHNPIVFVTWDDPNVYPNGVYPANLEKVKEPPFKVGDRVRFTGKHSAFFTNNFRVGKTGTVAEIAVDGYASIGVDWDNETRFFPVYHYPENLEKVTADKPTTTSNTFTVPTPDPVQALRDQANTIEEIAVAWQDVADKLRDSADAMENVSDLIDAATNNL